MDAFNPRSNPFKRRRFDYDDDSETSAAAAREVSVSLCTFDGDDTTTEDDDQEWVRVDEHTLPKPIFSLNNQQISFDADEAKNKKNSDKRAWCAAPNDNNNGSRGLVEPGTVSIWRLWLKDRSKDWWDRLNRPDVPDEEFRAAFRMSRATFNMICSELDAAVVDTEENSTLKEAVPTRQAVAVCIWRLATGEPLRLVSKRFGLGISTCHELVIEVCWSITRVLMPKYVQWPKEPQLDRIKRRFESLSGILNVAGSMYTTHVSISTPRSRIADHYHKRHSERNQRKSYSITIQGVVDDCGAFTDICIGWPGSMLDNEILEKSALYRRASMGLLGDCWIVGNSSHPMTDRVLVPYTQKNLTSAQHRFNERVKEVQRVAREAFARLKGRWAWLRKRTEVELADLSAVAGACCILHNICEAREEPVPVAEAEQFELFDDEMVADEATSSSTAQQARDCIAHSLFDHIHAGTAFL